MAEVNTTRDRCRPKGRMVLVGIPKQPEGTLIVRPEAAMSMAKEGMRKGEAHVHREPVEVLKIGPDVTRCEVGELVWPKKNALITAVPGDAGLALIEDDQFACGFDQPEEAPRIAVQRGLSGVDLAIAELDARKARLEKGERS